MINKKKLFKTTTSTVALAIATAMFFTACGSSSSSVSTTGTSQVAEAADTTDNTETTIDAQSDTSEDSSSILSSSGSGVLDTSSMFTDRDLEQTADLTDATTYTLQDSEDIYISEEGVYVITGTASDVTIYIEVADTENVQIVLDDASITNTSTPCIHVVSANKVFVTTQSDSSLSVTGIFENDDENAVIYSKDDLVLNGTATLTIQSSDEAVSSKDDLKITGGTYDVTSTTKAFDANDSIRIADGTFTINASTDAFHAENNDDDSFGYIYIADGSFSIDAGDDGIQGNAIVQIDGGTFTISAVEGIESTDVQINGGTFQITASDDGINATQKSTSYNVQIEINGGDITIDMGAGDTDALDSNGDLIISGGAITINAQSAFDYEGTGTYTGGTLIVNGQTVTELTQSQMGGGQMDGGRMMGGAGGGQMNGGQMGGKSGGR